MCDGAPRSLVGTAAYHQKSSMVERLSGHFPCAAMILGAYNHTHGTAGVAGSIRQQAGIVQGLVDSCHAWSEMFATIVTL